MTLFVEVARTLSFSAAGRQLDIPVATVSRRIAAFEQELGVSLFRRTTRRVELTETGRVHFERCSQVAEAARLAHAELRDDAQHPGGHLRVAMPVDLGVSIVAPWLAEFARQFPEITFEVDLSSIRLDRPIDKDDLVLHIGPITDERLIARPIGAIEMQLFAAPSYLQTHGRPLHPSDLSAHQCVTRRFMPHGAIWQFVRGQERCSVEVRGQFIVNNQGLIKTLLEGGTGIGMMPAVLNRESVAAGRLERVLPDWSLPPLPVHAVVASPLQPLRVRLLLAFLDERMTEI